MNTPPFEQHIGINAYLTTTYGVGGRLRTIPEDFIVIEESIIPPECSGGEHAIVSVTSTNWETHTLIKKISKQLNVSQKRIHFAGTKDRRAVTTQLMDFYDISQEQIDDIHIKDVTLQYHHHSNKGITIGDLKANQFKLTLRDLENIDAKTIDTTTQQLRDTGGFPNFYGIQRFGAMRPITHLVGKHIVNAQFEEAVMMYVAHPLPSEHEETRLLRARLQETSDFKEALANYPQILSFEKAMLNRLVKDPEDWTGAIQQLPFNLQTLLINAYQSYLFNKILSERINQRLPLNQALPGDIIHPIRKHTLQNEDILVTSENLEKVNHQLKKGNAFLTGLLPGADSHFAEGEMGEIEHTVIEEEDLNLHDFIIPKLPKLSSNGCRRALLTPVKELETTLTDDEIHEGQHKLILSFTLNKGCYATTLLREYMKADTPTVY